FGCREVHEECSIVVKKEDLLARDSLNSDQKNPYDTIMRHVDSDSPGVIFIDVKKEDMLARDSLNSDKKNPYDTIMRHVDSDSPGVIFIDGPGGTGKTFLYKALLATVCSRSLITLATASSGAKLIIWDEASMAKRQAVEAVDRTMQDITEVKLPFGGKIFVLGGDFRQVLPVVRRGTRAQIVDSSLRMSPLWTIIKKMRLTINMRARTDPWFSNFLLRVGDC
ncbi:ATP-dependent DNA helicase PIF1-like protein, partial [Tanacetum coccineum]